MFFIHLNCVFADWTKNILFIMIKFKTYLNPIFYSSVFFAQKFRKLDESKMKKTNNDLSFIGSYVGKFISNYA